MITTRRDTTVEEMTRNEARTRLGLLERTEPRSFNEAFDDSVRESDEAQTERVNKNFDMLLNYEKYIEEAKQKELEDQRISEQRIAAENAARVQERVVAAAAAAAAPAIEIDTGDITPSGTTMQFKTENVGELYNDLAKKNEEKESSKYRMNARGKLLIAVYAIVVVTILALIIINTSVLASIRNSNAESAALLAQKQAEYERVMEEYDYVSSDEYVINEATGEYGMVK